MTSRFEVAVAGLGDAAEPGFAAAAVLPRCQPIHAATWRPLLNFRAPPRLASSALAVVGPMPGSWLRRLLRGVFVGGLGDVFCRTSGNEASSRSAGGGNADVLVGVARQVFGGADRMSRRRQVTFCGRTMPNSDIRPRRRL